MSTFVKAVCSVCNERHRVFRAKGQRFVMCHAPGVGSFRVYSFSDPTPEEWEASY